MTEKELLQESFDLKLYTLLFLKKIPLLVLAGLLLAIIGMGAYYVKHTIQAPPPQYEASSRYYLTFAYDNEGDVYDHYNAYTWNDLAASEPILGYTMTLLPGYEKEVLRQAIVCTMPSDYRVITTAVTTDSPEKSMEIARATEQSLIHFGEIMPEFSKIEVIAPAEVSELAVENHLIKTGILWGCAGILAAFFLLLFSFVLDTSVYLPGMLEKRYGILALGIVCPGEKIPRELQTNLEYLCKGKQALVSMEASEENEVSELLLDSNTIFYAGCLEKMENLEILRATEGVILAVRYGSHNGPLIQKEIDFLKKQDCPISGLLLYHGDKKLLTCYYRTFKEWRL